MFRGLTRTAPSRLTEVQWSVVGTRDLQQEADLTEFAREAGLGPEDGYRESNWDFILDKSRSSETRPFTTVDVLIRDEERVLKLLQLLERIARSERHAHAHGRTKYLST
jgi:hypothetical protein